MVGNREGRGHAEGSTELRVTCPAPCPAPAPVKALGTPAPDTEANNSFYTIPFRAKATTFLESTWQQMNVGGRWHPSSYAPMVLVGDEPPGRAGPPSCA